MDTKLSPKYAFAILDAIDKLPFDQFFTGQDIVDLLCERHGPIDAEFGQWTEQDVEEVLDDSFYWNATDYDLAIRGGYVSGWQYCKVEDG